MRVLVCVILFMALAAAEPPSYRKFKVDFEIDEEPKLSELKEETPVLEEKRPYPAAGLKPLREFKLPQRFQELRQPLSYSELPSRENDIFRKIVVPQIYYGLPEGNNEEDNETKAHKQRTNEYLNSYEASVYPQSEYGTPGEEIESERKSEIIEHGPETSEKNSKESKGKIGEYKKMVKSPEVNNFYSTEKNKQLPKNNEDNSVNDVEIHGEGKFNSGKSYDKKKEEKEKKTERLVKEENTENKEKSDKGSLDESVKNPAPFYIVVQSTPNFDVLYQKPVPVPAVFNGIPFQRQIDFSNIGYSSYYQQRAIDSAPFSYYFQPKFQQTPYFLQNTGNQWANEW